MKTVFFICLIAFTCAIQNKKGSFTALQQASFGSMLAEVQAQIKSGGPLENIFGMLDDLEQQINTEQREHKDMLDRNQAACAEEKEFRTAEIQEGTKALRAATNQFNTCTDSQRTAEANLDTTVANLASDRAALASATRIREEQSALFLKRAADHVAAQRALDGAMNILEELVSQDASLLQLSQHSFTLLKSGVKIGLTGAYAPIVAMFAQMATANQDMFMENSSVERIRSMLEQLKENIAESARQYAEEEALRKAMFEETETQLNASIDALEARKMSLEDHIEEMKQCVLEEQLVMSQAEQKVNRNTGLLNTSTSMCQSFLDEFNTATESRDDELELLATVRSMVQQRLGNLKNNSVGQFDDGVVTEGVDGYDAAPRWD